MLPGVLLGPASFLWLWVLPLLLYAGVIWISSDIRYRAPIEPFVIWAGAFALTRIRPERQPPPSRPRRTNRK